VRDIDAGDSLDKSTATNARSIKRWKMFDRSLVCHLDWHSAELRLVPEASRSSYFELGSEDIGVTGIDSKPVLRFGFPVASTSLPV
jgi:hypothetical protein